jgi:hypothetical protein
MRRAVIRFVALFVFTTVFVEANAFAQLTSSTSVMSASRRITRRRSTAADDDMLAP